MPMQMGFRWYGEGNDKIKLPSFDWKEMAAETRAHPAWLHFGAGNLFRAFHAMIQQSLLEQGLVKGGIFTAGFNDGSMIDATYAAYDNLGILVTLLPDGNLEKTVIGSVAAGLRADPSYPEDYKLPKEIFRNPSLQMVTYTITEKGYALRGMDGAFTEAAEADFQACPHTDYHAALKSGLELI